MLARSLKIGIVCPYSWDTPGGVQNHIRDLAEFLIAAGHEVSVLAPAICPTPNPTNRSRNGRCQVEPAHAAAIDERPMSPTIAQAIVPP